MKKKILALCLVVVLAVTAVTGATLAYFTDKDKDTNVMTAGNVNIIQNETDRNGDAYDDGQALLPAVYLDAEGNPYTPTTTWEGPSGGMTTDNVNPAGGTMGMYTDSLENEIDKVVSVTNNGTLPAYVRTIILIENAEDAEGNELTDKLHILYTENENVVKEWINEITVDDKLYEAFVFTYQDPVAPEATTVPSLRQVWLDPSADNDWYDMLGDGELEIIALSQAAQTTGFGSPEEALNTAFGEVNDTNVTDWLSETTVKTSGLNNVVGGSLDSETAEG